MSFWAKVGHMGSVKSNCEMTADL